MKIKTLLSKYWLFIILFLLALIGAYFYFAAPSVKVPEITIPRPTPVPTSPVTALPPINTGFKPASRIIWRLDTLPIPETLSVIHVAGPLADPNTYSPLAKMLGITTQPVKLPNQPLYTWVSTDNAGSFYVNLRDKIASYSLNQDLKPIPTTGQKINSDILITNLINLLTPVLNLSENFSLVPGEVKYLIVADERYVPSVQSQATFAEVNLNYSFRNFALTYRGVPAVTARYSLYGPLVSLRLLLPFSQISLSPDYDLKSLSQIKETPAENFEIIAESGSRAFELSDKEEVMNSITITGGYVGYLTNPTSSAVTPYVFLTGTSQSKTYGTLNITLATPALKLQ
ncbi:hypothetical protein A3A84_00715 [Candidatus Collierbacteria bacterium RIFCSPLOWO2_01_FULL_50_23]|uniref:Uncharacterized protein n=1 Tax=Candidatus Collierbacteria bacterium RIFCSPHIGHO2_01_FULL_50_25 TaxID=1817722 RepID=A0A1F5EVD0_9BACT|nr:MAG: hypothetical protein A2703_01545 [Candidatus Collierbacteria bacterium RIFCSPHIGHO2_01_FULL_50_25]OGD74683.1 MAG: hypothetical protein A3A84_00715 [Candidatus Collierbacteria bacterium RIFCSPLOWO2_01_FULL_50_23]